MPSDEAPDPTPIAPAGDPITPEEALDAYADDRRAIMDAHRVRCTWSRIRSDRRRANAVLLEALHGMVRPSPLEGGFSDHGTLGDAAETALDRTIVAVLAEVEMMARSEVEAAKDDEPGEDR